MSGSLVRVCDVTHRWRDGSRTVDAIVLWFKPLGLIQAERHPPETFCRAEAGALPAHVEGIARSPPLPQ